MDNRTFLSLLKTPDNQDNLSNTLKTHFDNESEIVKEKQDYTFKTPKIVVKPHVEQNLNADTYATGYECSSSNNKEKKHSTCFSTTILSSSCSKINKPSEKKPNHYRYKSSSENKTDKCRILSNKLLKKSIALSKSSNTNIKNTIRSTVTTNNIKRNNSCLLITLVEGRGVASGEVGMASIDLKNPELELSQFSNSIGYCNTLYKLYLKSPIEIIFPHTMSEDGVRSKLFQIVSEYMPNSSITTIHRRYFNDKEGKESMQRLCHKDYTSVFYESREKYYALSACAALIKYVEFIQNMMFAPFSLKIIFSVSAKTMMLDISTVRNLELVENYKDLTDNNSLFSALNFTSTVGGYRLLRTNILQPSFDIPTIISRYDCIDELINNSELFFSLKTQIGHFVSLNHLLSLCVQLPKKQTLKSADKTITQIIALKHVMQLIPTLRQTLQKFKSSLLVQYELLLVDTRYEEILNMITTVVHEEVHFEKGVLQMRSQKLFAIKDGVHVLLDVARRSYSEQIETLRDEVQNLSRHHNLPLRVAFNNNFGFFIQLSINNTKAKPKLSFPFIKIRTVKNTINCTTEKIMKLNERLKGALAEIYLTAELILSELIKAIRVHMGVLYRLSEITATIDLLLSYAQVCKMQNYVRPAFTDTIALQNCRNPLHERLASSDTVSNHVYASSLSNFVIVTGANMSGKSMYLRQIALIQIMAQMGCFIPAEFASLRLTDHLFTRIGVDDDIQSNSSTFTIEMREIAYIINSVTDNSLILIDELGRGTSFDEGLNICFAICEHLLHSKAFTFIATHFIELTKLGNLYPNVQNVFFEVRNSSESENNNLIFTHRCIKGVCPYNTHGLRLAKLSNLPNELIIESEKIYQQLNNVESITEAYNCETDFNDMNFVIHKKMKILDILQHFAVDIQFDTEDLKQYLNLLQNQSKIILEKSNN